MEHTLVSSRKASLLSSHRVLRNTYCLLAMTLACSAITALLTVSLRLPSLHPLLFIVVAYGLMFLTHYTANSAQGILAVFALTGFLGYGLGPIVGSLLYSGASDVLFTALGGTSLVFFGCSAYVLTTKKEMSFMGGLITAGAVVLLISMVANAFLQIPAFSLGISALFILFSSGTILLKTSEIIHGGETNYIRATVSLYVSLYNIFVSLLNILSARRSD
jgi:modulator of FtsH protease